MKANKFFAVALAALALVGCKQNGGNTPEPTPQEDALVLNPTSLQLEVGENGTIEATVAATWATNNEAVATVAPANDGGKSAKVTAVAEGNAIITATTAGGQTKTCVVLVKAKGGETGAQLKGSQFWPIILDGTTLEANQSKMVASFQPNDVDQFLYVWEETYEGGSATGLNFYGNGDGYTALLVTSKGWAGMGFCLTATGNGWEAAEALRAAIVANPDDYFLHMAIKSTDNYSHCFYFMGNEGTKFGLGASAVYDAPAGTLKNFTRDGSWVEFDIPMSAYANALATPVEAGVNVFVALTEGVQGAQLNLDAVYFYKK
ncbi:MAG: Ig domain-containing protein [Paludibacteraceae bacterium]|nr:Ig domain-containing protein [Paludibacteraceae bacterium]